MNPHQNDQIKFLTFEKLDSDSRVSHGIFQRHGGCSPHPWHSLNLSTTVGDSRENVIENRKRIMRSLEFPDDVYYDVWQIHSDKVVIADKPRGREEKYIQADAILTNTPGIVLLMRFADCVPIFLFDPIKCVIGLVHAGWIGTVKKIAGASVENMKRKFGTNAKDVRAFIGPSISAEKYEVGKEVVDKVKNAFSNEWENLIQQNNRRTYFDLWKSNAIVLQNVGVENIELSGICTASDPTNWFSHRAEKGKTGRFGVLFGIVK